MNAGSILGEICDAVVYVEWMDSHGKSHRFQRDQCGFSYRKAENIPWGAMITRVCFHIHRHEFEAEQTRVQSLLKRRKQTQPLHLPSCGSVFKNPEGDYAGRLIEATSLKGYRIGGAEISSKHANFIVNVEKATAMDVYRLIRLAQERVWEQFNIRLETEVRLMGNWPNKLVSEF
ncbi:MAG: hypothetical protein VX278_04470, partial [Myxococcota bacterium]|nr:hypothetical protein [Myxococcota bacterium]